METNTVPQTRYTDRTPMPFGKFKGVALANVPAYILLGLYNKGITSDAALIEYIEDNLDILKSELK